MGSSSDSSRSPSPSRAASDPSSSHVSKLSNFGVEYVISFRYTGARKERAEKQFESLILALDKVGLRVEARDGRNGSILVFVRIKSQRKLLAEVYRSRVKDWLYGVRSAAPDKETQRSLDSEPVTDAERLRLVYQLLTLPAEEGGAGLTPGQGEWDLVESIFALHDRRFNKAWLKRWSTTWTIGDADLTMLRDKFGEKVGFYFAFLQSYFAFLLFAAVFGASSYFLLPEYSPVFALANGLWSIVFVEYWKRKEVDYAVRWGVRGCSKIQNKRAAFRADKEVEDPVTGEKVPVFSAWRRLARQALVVPFALVAAGVLAGFIASVFAIEIFLSEVYSGPGKSVLVFTPTVLLSVIMPTLTTILGSIAARLNNFENYENADSYDYAMTQKIFVINFVTSYVPLFLTAFVYVPFGSRIVPHLDVFALTAPQLSDEKQTMPPVFEINPDRLRKQVIYFTVTAQVVGLALELVVPVIKRRVFKKAKQFQSTRKDAPTTTGTTTTSTPDDKPQEQRFLTRVRDEAELTVYDVNSDLREMTTQFGYLALFAPIWPVAAVSFAINNWVELRSDAAKICLEMQRPSPLRADSIGPWLDNLQFLSWLGSVTSAALLYMFGAGGHPAPSLRGVLGAIIVAEHLYFVVRRVVNVAINKIESPGLVKERRERFLVRRRYLEESLGVEALAEREKGEAGGDGDGEDEGLAQGDERAFWREQSNPRGTAVVGKAIIGRAGEKKDQ